MIFAIFCENDCASLPVATASANQIGKNLVYRLAYNGDVAAGQLAVFQGASEAPISGSIRVERATRKNSQLAAARRVALKMGRRRCSSVTYRFRYAPSTASPARTALPTAHCERNDTNIICETVHQGFFAEMQSIRPRSASNPRPLCLTNVYFGQQ